MVMFASISMVGCGSKDTETTATTGGSLDKDQTLNLTLKGEPSTLDMSQATDEGSFSVAGQIMEGLTRLDKDGNKVLPGVAKSWKVSADGLTYTFDLRDDAKWSNGDAVTAHDFEFAWKRTLDPNTKSQYAFMVAWIKGGQAYNESKGKAEEVAITAKDDKTLEVTLDSPKSYFLQQLAFPVYYPQNEKFVKAQGDKYGADTDKVLSNGPFKLTKWGHDQDMALVKNDTYWDKDAVKLTNINFAMVTDSGAKMNLFESGQVDSIPLVREQIELFKDSKELATKKKMTSWYVQYNQRVKALTSAKVRQALTYAIDAKAFAEVTLGNGSVEATGLTPWAVGDGQGNEYVKSLGDLINRKDNAAKAKDLLAEGLKEVGESSFPKIKFLTSDGTTSRKQAEFIQEQWRKNLGIEIELEPVPSKLRFKRSADHDFDIVESGWSPDYNDAMSYLEMWTSDSDFNESGWKNAAYDDLIKQAKAEPDPKKHTQLEQDAEKLLMKEMPIGPLNFDASKELTKSYVKDMVELSIGPDWDLKYTYISGKN